MSTLLRAWHQEVAEQLDTFKAMLPSREAEHAAAVEAAVTAEREYREAKAALAAVETALIEERDRAQGDRQRPMARDEISRLLSGRLHAFESELAKARASEVRAAGQLENLRRAIADVEVQLSQIDLGLKWAIAKEAA